RLVLATSSAVMVANDDEEELGERGFFEIVHRNAALDTQGFVRSVRRALDGYCGDRGFPGDVSIVTVQREA
ncbi:MAG: hypothetical protein ACYTFV_13270, partial [Planctomycetota bacterium]